MTFIESIQTCFRKSFTLKGTASRSEYWYFALFIFLAVFALTIPFLILAGGTASYSSENGILPFLVVSVIFYLCILPASICATVRRLHDIGKPGTYYFIGLIPYIGGAILLYFLVKPTKEDSPYREDKVNLLDEWDKEAEL